MLTLGKVVGYLQATFGLTPSTGVGSTVSPVFTVTDANGSTKLKVDGPNDNISVGAGALLDLNAQGYRLTNTTVAAELASGRQFGWSSTAACNGTADTGLQRVAAGVVGPTDGGSNGKWLQNTAGTARNTADVTNATTAFASLPDLTLNLLAGRKYVGRLVVPLKNTTAAEGVKFDLNGGSATFTSIEFGFSAALGATVGVRTSTAIATAITLTALADTNDVIIEIPITCVVNAAGTLIPRQAENSHSTGTLTVRAGAYIVLEDSPN